MCFHLSIDLPLRILFPESLPLVVGFLSAPNGNQDLGDTSLIEICLEGNKRHAASGGLDRKAMEFLFVDQQLAATFGIVIPQVGLAKLSNVGTNQPQLIALVADVGFFERQLSFAQCFDFAAVQYDATFELFRQFKVVTRLAVLGNQLVLAGPGTFLFGGLVLRSWRGS